MQGGICSIGGLDILLLHVIQGEIGNLVVYDCRVFKIKRGQTSVPRRPPDGLEVGGVQRTSRDYKLVYRIDPVSEGILQLPGFPNTYTQEDLLLRN